MPHRIPRPLDVYAINLDRDTERWTDTQDAFEPFDDLSLIRSPGIDATNLPGAAVKLLCRTRHDRLGTLGCFMAHVKAWEAAARRKRGWALIIEDDIAPLNLKRLFRVPFPDDADLVWLNRRMDPGLHPGGGSLPLVVPVREMLPRKAALKPGRAAPGGDAYLLSAHGARKLLAAVEADGMAQHVDWMLLRYALSPDEVRAGAGESWLLRHPALDPDATAMGWSVVTAYCLSPALTKERPGRESSRRINDGQGTVHTETPDGLVSEFSAAGCRFRFLVADRVDTIQRQHFAGRLYEPEELGIIQAHFPRGGVYVDIGANVGNHAIFVARRLAPSRVHVVEPNPAAIAILRVNLRLNDVEHIVDVSRLGMGLGDEPAMVGLLPRDHNLGATRLSPKDGPIPVVPGDEALAGLRPDFLKIDVEGMELAVLRGLVRTIDAHRPSVFVEVDNRNAGEVTAWTDAKGYVVVDRFRRYAANENMMLVPRERAAGPKPLVTAG